MCVDDGKKKRKKVEDVVVRGAKWGQNCFEIAFLKNHQLILKVRKSQKKEF